MEIEAAEPTTTKLTRQRLELDFEAMVGASAIDAPDFPTIPGIVTEPGNQPVAFTLTGLDVTIPDSVYRVSLRPVGGGREWTVLISANAIADSAPLPADPPRFQFPETEAMPFDQPGVYELVVEVFEFPPLSFDFDRFALSDVERDHQRAARTLTVTVDTQ